jgi:hypothetical protein
MTSATEEATRDKAAATATAENFEENIIVKRQ